MDIRAALMDLQDPEYCEFHSRLMPGIDKETIIGVRVPALRQLARQIKETEEAEAFLKELPHTYYEENNLHGLLLAEKKDYEQCIKEVKIFLPYIDNWATCDILSPKVFKKNRQKLLQEIPGMLASEHTYVIRFGIRMLMDHFLDEDFDPAYLQRIAEIRSEEYYVNMMIAWYFATALAKQYETVIPYLEQKKLSVWCHNKTIRKAIESYRITADQKQYLRTLQIRN